MLVETTSPLDEGGEPMWVTNELGVASFQQGSWRLDVDARGGVHGIRINTSNAAECRAAAHVAPAAAEFQSVADDVLPNATDQFIRGDEWHVSLPQESGSYWLDIVFRPLEQPPSGHSPAVVLEATLSIHTSLLDSHPMIDLCSRVKGLRCLDASGTPRPDGGATTKKTGSAAITLGEQVAVLLGPRDHPFTSDCSTSDELRLRLFGEFLEKGVIRKARPWIVFGSTDNDQAAEFWERLSGTPLPLTA